MKRLLQIFIYMYLVNLVNTAVAMEKNEKVENMAEMCHALHMMLPIKLRQSVATYQGQELSVLEATEAKLYQRFGISDREVGVIKKWGEEVTKRLLALKEERSLKVSFEFPELKVGTFVKFFPFICARSEVLDYFKEISPDFDRGLLGEWMGHFDFYNS